MDDARTAARQHVKRLKAFYSHVFAYVVINGFLVAVNLLTTPETLWFYWVTLAWGLGLAFDAYDTFLKHRLFGHEWEERKIQNFMEKNPDARPEDEVTEESETGKDS